MLEEPKNKPNEESHKIINRPKWWIDTSLKSFDGIPFTKSYKYLGIIVDRNFSHIQGLNKNCTKLEIYLRRNAWLLEDNFSPKTLVAISRYFHQSRLTYGMSCFLDKNTVIKKMDSIICKFVKSTIKIENTVN